MNSPNLSKTCTSETTKNMDFLPKVGKKRGTQRPEIEVCPFIEIDPGADHVP